MCFIVITFSKPVSFCFMCCRGKMASLRRVRNNSALPNSESNPQISLSQDLPSSADLKFVSDKYTILQCF